jgi:hypothetical protein
MSPVNHVKECVTSCPAAVAFTHVEFVPKTGLVAPIATPVASGAAAVQFRLIARVTVYAPAKGMLYVSEFAVVSTHVPEATAPVVDDTRD